MVISQPYSLFLEACDISFVMKKSILRLTVFLSRVLPVSVKRALYRLGPLSRLIRRSLNRAAPTGLTEIEISAGALAGMKMRLDLQSEKDYWLGTYEVELQSAIGELVQPGWTVYDVGANVGYISLMLARAVGETGRIFAFEALPANVERLRENLALNRLESPRVQVVHGAVAAASAPVRFLIGPSDDMGKADGSAGRQTDYIEAIEVPGLSLDEFIYTQGNPAPHVIKMDIEGGEVLALPGMKRLLAEARPLILLELHGPEAARLAWETLTAAGYTIARMQKGYPGVASIEKLDWKSYLVARTGDHRQQTTDRGRWSAVCTFPGRLALQQRVLPAYRAPFFDLLAQACAGGLSVFAGQPLPVEGIAAAEGLQRAEYVPARNRHFSDPATKFYLCWQRGIIEWLEVANPDALIVEANPRYWSNRLAIRWMKKRGRPVLGWGLGAPPLGGILSPLRMRARLRYLSALDGLLAYSQKGAAEYRALGLPPQRVFVAANSVMPRPTYPLPARPPEFDGPPMVLFVGRLQARKRLDILLNACAALPVALQPRLVIVGDGPVISHLQSLASQIYPRTEFVGAKHGAELESYFHQADLFALPGTGGLAVQQAMAYGLPVIVARGDGTQDDLVRPANGWQVPPGEQDAFTATLHEALSDVSRLRAMGTESYRIVAEEINLGAMVAAFVNALNML